MTTEEKRIKLVEADGWTKRVESFDDGTVNAWYPPVHYAAPRLAKELPDYFNDLNAVCNLVNTLKDNATLFSRSTSVILW